VEWIVGLLLGPIIRTHWVAAGQLMYPDQSNDAAEPCTEPTIYL
jgi:hypothetical protein